MNSTPLPMVTNLAKPKEKKNKKKLTFKRTLAVLTKPKLEAPTLTKINPTLKMMKKRKKRKIKLRILSSETKYSN